MKLSKEQIRQAARKIVFAHATGIRFAQLRDAILSQHPETPRGTVEGTLVDLPHVVQDIVRPSRGVFMPASAVTGGTNAVAGPGAQSRRLR